MATNRALLSSLVHAVSMFMAASTAPAISAEPESFPLLCRGSTSFMLEIDRAGGRESFLIVHFRGAAAGASARKLERGECAWLDRGWRSGEPQYFRWGGDLNNVMLRFTADGRLGSVEAAGVFGGEGVQLKYLLDALRSDREYQVHAYTLTGDRDRYLKVTRVGPQVVAPKPVR